MTRTRTRIPHHRGSRRASVTRRVAIVAVAGAATVGVGVGIAHAQGTSPRSQALRAAAAQASLMPQPKAHLFTAGIAGAFPSQAAAKPAQAPAGPVAAPGVPKVDIPDSRVPGISSLRQAPFAPVDFSVQSSYAAKVRGRWYVTYAGTIGGDRADKGEGGVRIISADPGANTNMRDLGEFPVAGTTELKVTGDSGTMITLVTNTGATLRFDLSTLTYR